MTLTLNQTVLSRTAAPADARAALDRLHRSQLGELRLNDGSRSLSLQLEGGAWFLEAEEGSKLRYGMLVNPLQAVGAVNSFFKGGLPLPGGWAPEREGLESVVVGDAFHPDCPLCKMMGPG